MNEISVILLLTGTLLVAAGLLSRRYPPPAINSLYGYRTFSSMKNENTWKEANRYAPVLMIKVACFLLVAGVVSLFIPIPRLVGVVTGLGLVLCSLAFLIWRTERRLASVFNEKGERRQTENR